MTQPQSQQQPLQSYEFIELYGFVAEIVTETDCQYS